MKFWPINRAKKTNCPKVTVLVPSPAARTCYQSKTTDMYMFVYRIDNCEKLATSGSHYTFITQLSRQEGMVVELQATRLTAVESVFRLPGYVSSRAWSGRNWISSQLSQKIHPYLWQQMWVIFRKTWKHFPSCLWRLKQVKPWFFPEPNQVVVVPTSNQSFNTVLWEERKRTLTNLDLSVVVQKHTPHSNNC